MKPDSISEVIGQLDEIVKYTSLHSNRAGYFAALYKKVTIAVANKIKEGYFDDGARMEKLDVVFANRYLEAYQNYTSGKPCSASWKLAFDTTKSWKPMVIHHLLEGMNAHISLDLGIAAATIAPGAAISDIQNDFNKINAILNELTEEVKTELFDLWPLTKLFSGWHTGRIENAVAGFSMSIARDAAWEVALDYAALPNQQARDNFTGKRDNAVAAFGKQLLYPGFFLNGVLYIFRLFEWDSIQAKINKLNH